MCGITAALTVASFAVSAASTIVGHNASVDEYNQNQKNAITAMYQEQKTLRQRELQEQEAAGQKARQIALKGAVDRADAETKGVQQGSAGTALSSVLTEVDRRSSDDLVTNETNWKMTAEQLQREQESTVIRAQSRINSKPKPSAAGAMLSIAGAGVKAAGSLNSM